MRLIVTAVLAVLVLGVVSDPAQAYGRVGQFPFQRGPVFQRNFYAPPAFQFNFNRGIGYGGVNSAFQFQRSFGYAAPALGYGGQAFQFNQGIGYGAAGCAGALGAPQFLGFNAFGQAVYR